MNTIVSTTLPNDASGTVAVGRGGGVANFDLTKS
jgi:hypothetical protein